jgi:hypothetical protein
MDADRRGSPYLLYRDEGGAQRLFVLPERAERTDRLTVGRDPASDIALAWDAEVSRAHAQLERVGGVWTVVDDGLSTNGTFVNGERVSGRRRLVDGDTVRFGTTTMTFRTSQEDEQSTVIAGDAPAARRVISARTAAQVAKMLEGVLGPGGTAEEAKVPGYTLAGKTGTAQKPDPVNGGYSKTKYFASFIGFAPARNPRLLVAVMVDEPQGQIYGGEVAAPAFEKIVSFALPYLRIPPQ